MAYRHQLGEGVECDAALGKIVCVGRNYAAHARELNNPVEAEPLLFLKPATAAVPMAGEFAIPKDRGAVHHELELAVLVGRPLTNASETECRGAIAGIGLAFDLTLRDLQNSLKEKSHPWERAKAFDGSCPLSMFVRHDGVDLTNLTLSLECNGKLQQQGNSADMLFPVVRLMALASEVFTLLPGDVVLTGTPSGVGPLQVGDRLVATLGGDLLRDSLLRVESRVL